MYKKNVVAKSVQAAKARAAENPKHKVSILVLMFNNRPQNPTPRGRRMHCSAKMAPNLEADCRRTQKLLTFV